MSDIKAAIKSEIRLLEAKVSKLKAALSALGEKAVKRAKKTRRTRAPKGTNRKKVIKAMSATPMRATDIAKKAGMSQQALQPILKVAVEKGEMVKKGRGLYALKSAKPKAAPKKAKKPAVKAAPKEDQKASAE